MASEELQQVVNELRDFQDRARAARNAGAAEPPDPAGLARRQRAAELPSGTQVIMADAAGVRCEWVIVAGADPGNRILYLHGGGYAADYGDSHRGLAARLSASAGCAVLAAAYRVAPAFPFPAAVDDSLAALRWMIQTGPEGLAPARATFVVGDSAGGGLALALLLAARDAGITMPAAAVTMSAWADLTMSGESLVSRRRADPMVTPGILARLAQAYLGETDPRQPLASPLFGDLRGLPPLLMQVGDAEVLLDDTVRFAERARAADVSVTVEVEPDAPHVFQTAASASPEAKNAMQRAGAFISHYARLAAAAV